jgi:signal transduction histidine kinase
MVPSERLIESELAALESITQVALSTVDVDDLLDRLIARMVEVSGAQAGAILLLQDGRLAPSAAYDLQTGQTLDGEPGGLDFAWRVVREARPFSERDKPSLGIASSLSIRSRLGVPLKTNGQVIGVARLDLLESREFTPAEIHRFEVLADRAAIAIAHARALQASRERAVDLELVNAELREVDRLKTNFLSMVSHELRTPLTAIIGYTDLLLRGTHGALSERQLRHQAAVKQAAQRLLALINDLLDVSRLQSAQVELELAPVSLAEVFDEALSGARELAANAQLSLRVELPTNLPLLRADRDRLVQVLNNLLSNAIKFTPPGGRVELQAEQDEAAGLARISVSDTGAGIAAEHLDHIWDSFYQADSSVRRRFGGTGLGLAIVRMLVELHGGRVAAESGGPDQGARFSFQLPIQDGSTIRSPVAPVALDSQPVSAATVLVVEDHPDNRELLATVLQEVLQLQVITARDGVEALERAATLPDLILLDLILPRLDGFEVVRRLKADPRTRHIPVLALTALTDESERQEALSAGCDGLIVKPFDTDTLVQTVAARLTEAADIRPSTLSS